jgi:hypothetical protein
MTSPARLGRRGRLALLSAGALALFVPLVMRDVVTGDSDAATGGRAASPASPDGAEATATAAAPAASPAPPAGDEATATAAAPAAEGVVNHRGPRCWGRSHLRWCRPFVTTTTAPTTAPPSAEAAAGRQAPASPNYSRGAFPNPASTGTPAGWQPAATHDGNLTVGQPGAVIEDMLITGAVIVHAPNVTIRRSRVYGTISNWSRGQEFGGLLIEDVEIGPDSGVDRESTDGAVGTYGYTARRVEIHNMVDGFRVAGDNVRIEDSYVKVGQIPGECPHYDGTQGYYGGTNVAVYHNTIDDRGECVNGAVFFADSSEYADVQGNLLIGGSFSIKLNQVEVPSTFVVKGNRVVEGSYQYGPISIVDSGSLNLTCSDNRLVTIDANLQVTSDRGEFGCR